MNKKLRDIKPLSKGMIEFLMDCHEKELMGLPPNHATKRYSSNLLKRKLLIPKIYIDSKGKKVISLYTSQLGRDYLSNIIETSSKNKKSK